MDEITNINLEEYTDEEKVEILSDFVNNMVENSQDCPDFAYEVLGKHFWELIGE